MKYEELPEDVCEQLIIELFQALPELLLQIAPNGFSNANWYMYIIPTPNNSIKNTGMRSSN